MDFMIAAAGAALANIGLLSVITFTYIQNIRVIKSYFTYGLVMVASLFMLQNIVVVIFWSTLYMAGPSIQGIINSAAPYLFAINSAQKCVKNAISTKLDNPREPTKVARPWRKSPCGKIAIRARSSIG